MAIITKMPGEAIIAGFKGKLDFYIYMGLNCVRKWPKSPGHDRAPAVQAQWIPFLEAVAAAKLLSPQTIQFYTDNAAETGMTWKDVFFRSYMSGLPTEVYQGKE